MATKKTRKEELESMEEDLMAGLMNAGIYDATYYIKLPSQHPSERDYPSTFTAFSKSSFSNFVDPKMIFKTPNEGAGDCLFHSINQSLMPYVENVFTEILQTAETQIKQRPDLVNQEQILQSMKETKEFYTHILVEEIRANLVHSVGFIDNKTNWALSRVNASDCANLTSKIDYKYFGRDEGNANHAPDYVRYIHLVADMLHCLPSSRKKPVKQISDFYPLPRFEEYKSRNVTIKKPSVQTAFEKIIVEDYILEQQKYVSDFESHNPNWQLFHALTHTRNARTSSWGSDSTIDQAGSRLLLSSLVLVKATNVPIFGTQTNIHIQTMAIERGLPITFICNSGNAHYECGAIRISQPPFFGKISFVMPMVFPEAYEMLIEWWKNKMQNISTFFDQPTINRYVKIQSGRDNNPELFRNDFLSLVNTYYEQKRYEQTKKIEMIKAMNPKNKSFEQAIAEYRDHLKNGKATPDDIILILGFPLPLKYNQDSDLLNNIRQLKAIGTEREDINRMIRDEDKDFQVLVTGPKYIETNAELEYLKTGKMMSAPATQPAATGTSTSPIIVEPPKKVQVPKVPYTAVIPKSSGIMETRPDVSEKDKDNMAKEIQDLYGINVSEMIMTMVILNYDYDNSLQYLQIYLEDYFLLLGNKFNGILQSLQRHIIGFRDFMQNPQNLEAVIEIIRNTVILNLLYEIQPTVKMLRPIILHTDVTEFFKQKPLYEIIFQDVYEHVKNVI